MLDSLAHTLRRVRVRLVYLVVAIDLIVGLPWLLITLNWVLMVRLSRSRMMAFLLIMLLSMILIVRTMLLLLLMVVMRLIPWFVLASIVANVWDRRASNTKIPQQRLFGVGNRVV
jgi:hypothetical protein